MLSHAFLGQIYFLLAISLYFRRKHIFFKADDRSLRGISYLIFASLSSAFMQWLIAYPESNVQSHFFMNSAIRIMYISAEMGIISFALSNFLRPAILPFPVKICLLLAGGIFFWAQHQNILTWYFTQFLLITLFLLPAAITLGIKFFRIYKLWYSSEKYGSILWAVGISAMGMIVLQAVSTENELLAFLMRNFTVRNFGVSADILEGLFVFCFNVTLLVFLNALDKNILKSLEQRAKFSESRFSFTQKRLSALMDNIPGLVYRCLNDVHWTMLFVSEGCQELTGYSPEALTENKVYYNDIIHPDDRDRIHRMVNRALERGKKFTMTYRIVHKDGFEKWVWEQGQRIEETPLDKREYLEGLIIDITNLKTYETELKKSEEKFRFLIELAKVGIWEIGSDGKINFANHRMTALLGLPSESMKGRAFTDFFISDDLTRGISYFKETLKGNTSQHEIRLLNKFGDKIPVMAEMTPVYNSDGTTAGSLAYFFDISERKKAEEQLRYLADHDPLTGVANRNYFMALFTEAIENQLVPETLTLFFIDFDSFKWINDTYGHDTGDILLKRSVALLQAGLGKKGILARIGGDQFAALYTGDNDVKAVEQIALRMIESVKAPFHIGNEEIRSSVSIGIARYPHDSTDVAELLKMADKAMNRSKKTENNHFIFYSESIQL